jgi:hypothetical protein
LATQLNEEDISKDDNRATEWKSAHKSTEAELHIAE